MCRNELSPFAINFSGLAIDSSSFAIDIYTASMTNKLTTMKSHSIAIDFSPFAINFSGLAIDSSFLAIDIYTSPFETVLLKSGTDR